MTFEKQLIVTIQERLSGMGYYGGCDGISTSPITQEVRPLVFQIEAEATE